MKYLACTKMVCLTAFSFLLALLLLTSTAHSALAASTMPSKVVASHQQPGIPWWYFHSVYRWHYYQDQNGHEWADCIHMWVPWFMGNECYPLH